MIETYFTSRKELKAVLLIIDLRHPPMDDDVLMYDFLKYYELPCIVIATKADKIPRGKWQKHVKMAKETLNLQQEDKIIVFSSETGEGKDKVWGILGDFQN